MKLLSVRELSNEANDWLNELVLCVSGTRVLCELGVFCRSVLLNNGVEVAFDSRELGFGVSLSPSAFARCV